MQNKEANLRLIKRINELDEGEYEVNTSKGKFKIEKTSFEEFNDFNNEICRKIFIADEKGNPFSQYYFRHSYDHKWYDYKAEREIDYSNQTNMEYGYSVDIKNGKILIYQNDNHTKFYQISEDHISDEKNKILAWIDNDTISDRSLIEINLNNFDRTILINNKEVIIPKDENIEEEITKYNQEVIKLKQQITNNKYLQNIINEDLCTFKLNKKDVKFSDFKSKEDKLLKLYKLYLEAMKIMNYQHDIETMREIVAGLNSEFNKIIKYADLNSSIRHFYCNTKCTFTEEILKLKCGIYFIETSKGLIQIDRFTYDYTISDEKGNIITEIIDPILTNEIVMGIENIVQNQQIEDKEHEKSFKKEQIKQLRRELKMLEN